MTAMLAVISSVTSSGCGFSRSQLSSAKLEARRRRQYPLTGGLVGRRNGEADNGVSG